MVEIARARLDAVPPTESDDERVVSGFDAVGLGPDADYVAGEMVDSRLAARPEPLSRWRLLRRGLRVALPR